jgi:hypothetical protein
MAALQAHLENARPFGDGRTAPRRKLNLAVQGTTALGIPANVLIHNLSTTGLLIETAADLSLGEVFEVEIPHAGATPTIVIWRSDRLFGCEFATPVGNAAISAALLRTPAVRPEAVALAEDFPQSATDAYVREASESRDQAKLPIRTRVSIIVGSSLVLWALIIWTFTKI